MINLGQNLPHALLIQGNPEALFSELNKDLQLLLCERAKACGACPSCQLFQSEAGHPDLIIARPEGKLNITKIDVIREVIAFLEQSAMRGGMRIVVFTEAETMNIAAQNALLKSLEEPGAKTLIVLMTAKAHLLLPTIRSRCQVLKIHDERNTQNLALAETLTHSFDALNFVETHRDLDLLDCVHTQMNLIHDCLSLQLGNYALTYTNLQSKLNELASRISSLKLASFYKELAQKSALFQKKIAVNQELCLFELALAWKRLIAQNTP